MEEERLIIGSLRPDGTRRKDIKIKAGYINQEEVPKYVIPQRREGANIIKTNSLINNIIKSNNLIEPKIIKTPLRFGLNMDELKDNQTTNEKKRLKKSKNKQTKSQKILKSPNDNTNNTNNTDNTDVDQLTKMISTIDINKDLDMPISEKTKQIRKIRKKLREIETLEEKEKSNEILNSDEKQKLNSKSMLLERVIKLEKSRFPLK